MKNEILKIPATISKVTTMSDRSLRLQVDTQEMVAEDAAQLMLMKDNIGVFVFAESDIKVEDLKELPKVELEDGEKSPSVRLRSVLYVYWEQHKINKTFDSFYKEQVEKFIQVIKDKLD
jgi:hypothetical protein